MTEFEQKIHGMFDHIWDCEIDHPCFQDTVGELMTAIIQCYELLPSAKPVKYTKADYIMALHKEYGCALTMAEEAHNKALEYLRSKARMKG